MEKLTTKDLVDALMVQSGSSRKLMEQLVREFTEIIIEGLEKDGIVKIRGLGTFRLKQVAKRIGRNLQTGEQVEIPPHNKVTFSPDKTMKEFVNKEYQFLTYKEVEDGVKDKPSSQKTEPVIPEKEDIKITPAPSTEQYVAPVQPEKKVYEPERDPVKPESRQKGSGKKYLWIIPLVIIIIAVLIIIFYFRACDTGILGPKEKELDKTEQQLPPQEPQVVEPAEDTVNTEVEDIPEETDPVPEPEEPASPGEDIIYMLEPGNYLYQLAGQFYGDSLYWVLIYKANEGLIADPGQVAEGSSITIPTLEGNRHNLTYNDSLHLSAGYQALYEYYMIEEDPLTTNFYFGMMRYMPRK